MFELHPQLKKDTFFIKDLKLCQILLLNNSHYPWFVLVPKKPKMSEIIDLSKKDQALLMNEIAAFSKVLKHHLKPTKLNVAAFGNMVPQLHIHIIARFKDDLTFPKPVWVSNETRSYSKKEVEKVTKWINDEM